MMKAVKKKKSEHTTGVVNNRCEQIEEADESSLKKPKFSNGQISSVTFTSILKPPEANLPSILSTMLIEQGILVQEGDTLSVMDSRMIQLETADGNHVMIQLEEEDEEQESSQQTIEVRNVIDEIRLVRRPVSSTPTDGQLQEETVGVDAVNSSSSGIGSSTRCGECGKRLSSRGALWRHVRDVHQRARPHACAVCGRAFAQAAVLKRHELVHREQRPHACVKCGRSFTQAAALAAHAQSHIRPRPAMTLHCCTLCDKMFLYASGLSRHMATHSGREFACVRCDRRFSDRSSLIRHMRRANHSQDPEEEDV